jgi:hypothetical protein
MAGGTDYRASLLRGDTHVMNDFVSVNVGLPRDILWQGRIVRTSIFASPPSRAKRSSTSADTAAI